MDSESLVYGGQSSGKPEARPGKQNLYKARLKESLPWFINPLRGLKGKDKKYFRVRHEASMMELFFDLFFVANLATFTAYHEITDSETVMDYIGFFAIMWLTWFHITIYDVRFGPDCVYERLCKLCQFIVFVMFAAVGGSFAPGSYDSLKNYRIMQTMAVILAVSRWFLGIQHAVVAFCVIPKHKKLLIPLTLIVITYLLSGSVIFGTFFTFNSKTMSYSYIAWYVMLFVESVSVLTISSIWRMLSFKETHMNERLSLLTMIIIGEGVIGVTKTAGYLWPTTYAPSAGSIVAVLSIVVMLFLLWQTYFDNHPHGDYGTIKQQWWALAHFLLHLGYVGIVEGSNQMATFYYSAYTVFTVDNQIWDICMTKKYSNLAFVTTLNATIQKLKIEKYDPRGYDNVQLQFEYILDWPTNVCSNINGTKEHAAYETIYYTMRDATFAKFGVQPAREEAFLHTFRTAFRYYWISMALALFMLLVFLYIVRRQKHDVFEWVRMTWRLITAVLCLAIMCISFLEDQFVNFVASPWVVLSAVVLMLVTVFIDRVARWVGLWHFRRKYNIPVLGSDDHDHRHATSPPSEGHTPDIDRQSMMMWGKNRPASFQSVNYAHARNQSESDNVPLTSYRPSYISVESDEHMAPGFTAYADSPNLLSPDFGQQSPPTATGRTVERPAPPYRDSSYGNLHPEIGGDLGMGVETGYTGAYGGGGAGYYDPTHPR